MHQKLPIKIEITFTLSEDKEIKMIVKGTSLSEKTAATATIFSPQTGIEIVKEHMSTSIELVLDSLLSE